MTMTKQEQNVQLEALAREISGHETAVSNWEEQKQAAEERGDSDEANRFAKEIASSETTISAAKKQIAMLSGEAKTPRQRGSKRA